MKKEGLTKFFGDTMPEKTLIMKKLENLKREIEELEDLIRSKEEEEIVPRKIPDVELIVVAEEGIVLREIPEEEARKLILDYIEKHPGCLTSEIIENLALDPLLVGRILRQLEKEGKIEGRGV